MAHLFNLLVTYLKLNYTPKTTTPKSMRTLFGFECFWFLFCSPSLPVQGPVCQPDGADPAFSHNLPDWNKRGEWRHPHHRVSTVSGALGSLEEENEWGRGADTHGNNSAWKRTINGNDGVNYLLKGSIFLCIKEQQKGSCVVVVQEPSSPSKSESPRFVFKSSTEPISGNTSLTFLITLDKDLGDLMFLKLRWEGAALWKNVWKRVQTMIPWGGAERQAQLTVGKISIKAGETQERYSFTFKEEM